MATLTPAQRQAAEEMGTEMFNLEKMIEEHNAILRTDPDRVLEVNGALSKDAPKPFPDLKDIDEWIRRSEEVLTKPCTEFADHVAFVNAAMYLSQLKSEKLVQTDYAAYLEAVRVQDALRLKEHPALAQMALPGQPQAEGMFSGSPGSESRDTEPEDPISMPVPPFTFDTSTIDDVNRTPVLPAEIDEYRRNPNALMNGQIFVSCEDDEVHVFKVAAILSKGPQKKTFYVVSSEDPDEAVAYSEFFFFDMLASSERVVT
ncbi:hypothetical protein B0H11DRAFT_2126917 [Mycena galericulata]|nr:hypothetical protein B0H11DRAFT_2126917 [Mycena galericulata]